MLKNGKIFQRRRDFVLPLLAFAMAIAGLDVALRKRGGFVDAPLEQLQNATLGVDARHLVGILLGKDGDATFEALGGVPATLQVRLGTWMEDLAAQNTRVVFVFEGLRSKHALDARKALTPNVKVALDAAWKAGKPLRGVEGLEDTRVFDAILMDWLAAKGAEFIVAPYYAQHQLKYMLDNGVIDAMMTSNEALLLFALTTGQPLEGRVIVGFSQNKFQYLDLALTMQALQLTMTMALPTCVQVFRQMAMLAGNVFQPYKITDLGFEAILASYQSVMGSLKKEDQTKFLNGMALLKFTPVLKQDGCVAPIPFETTKSFLSGNFEDPKLETLPGDIYQVFGAKFPDEYFFYQSIGLGCLDTVESTSSIVEKLPIDQLMSVLYENLTTSDQSLQLRADLVNLLTSKFNRAFQRVPIKVQSSLRGKVVEETLSRFPPDYVGLVDSLVVHQAYGEDFILDHFVTSLSGEYVEKCRSDRTKLLATNYELVATSLLRGLVTYGLLDGAGKPTTWLDTLVSFAKTNNVDVEEMMLVTLLFKRVPNLTKRMFVDPKPKSLIRASLVSEEIALISKLASIHVVTPTGSYNGPVSQELRHFTSCVTKLKWDASECVKVHMIRMLLANDRDYAKVSRESVEWKAVSKNVPFKVPPSALCGLLAQTALEQTQSKAPLDLSAFDPVLANASAVLLETINFVLKTFKLIALLAQQGLVNADLAALALAATPIATNLAEVLNSAALESSANALSSA